MIIARSAKEPRTKARDDVSKRIDVVAQSGRLHDEQMRNDDANPSREFDPFDKYGVVHASTSGIVQGARGNAPKGATPCTLRYAALRCLLFLPSDLAGASLTATGSAGTASAFGFCSVGSVRAVYAFRASMH